jgi:hypothetical protein
MMAKTTQIVSSQRRKHTMKKLMTLMIGLSLTLGTAVMFAQDTPKKEDTKTEKKAGKKGGKKKSGDDTKKTEPAK